MTNPMQWCAVYKDGSVHTEEELQNSEKIDRAQLREFKLLQDGKLIFSAFFDDPKRKLIFRRRVFLSGLTGQVKDMIYLVGWHENVKGVSVKSICYVYSDGHIEFDDDRSDLELVPCEL